MFIKRILFALILLIIPGSVLAQSWNINTNTRPLLNTKEDEVITSIEDLNNYDFFKNRKWKEDLNYFPLFRIDMDIYNKINSKAVFVNSEGKTVNNKGQEVDLDGNIVEPMFNTNFYSISFSTPKNLPSQSEGKKINLLVDGVAYNFWETLWFEGKEHDIEIYYEVDWEKKHIINWRYDISKIIEMDIFYQQNLFTAEVENKMSKEEIASIYDKKEENKNISTIVWILCWLLVLAWGVFTYIKLKKEV